MRTRDYYNRPIEVEIVENNYLRLWTDDERLGKILLGEITVENDNYTIIMWQGRLPKKKTFPGEIPSYLVKVFLDFVYENKKEEVCQTL